MDFIFGTYATDDLKLLHHRMSRRGVQHAYELSPRDALPNQPVTLTVQIGTDTTVSQVACYFTIDGSEPDGSRGVAKNGMVLLLDKADTIWDVLNWGYLNIWRGVFPPQPDGAIVRYKISAWSAVGSEIFADWPDVTATAEQAASAFFKNEPFLDTLKGSPSEGVIFQYRVDTLTPPDWARKAIIYHIFVDRFYPGDGKTWNNAQTLMDFYGGTLWGVRDKMDYIADLGATCIWLSPTWVSPSHHGYDVTDYTRVEPRLGGDEALHAVVEAAHSRGIRVLLDMVCNHLSNEHPFFRDARSDPHSPYRCWFTFDDSEVGYRTFFGTPFMPELNFTNPDARQWMIDTARYWLREFKIDGYRLDYANGPGPGFWSDFWAACKAEKPDAFCFGEIVDAPHTFLRYVGRLDGCLDFHLGETLRKTYAYKTWTEVDFERFLERHQAYFPEKFILPSFLDNHDMDRFLYIAKGDKAALKRAAAVQMRLPNPPIIYYGTEVGLSQRYGKSDNMGLEISREPMIWGDQQDKEMLAYYKTLIQKRHG